MRLSKTMLFALAVVLGCSGPSPSPDRSATTSSKQATTTSHSTKTEAPQRIILMIGDGMGLNYVTAAAYANGGPLHMMSMPEFGAITTHEYEFVGTDSAASATAFATGRKTHYEGVSVTPGTTPQTEEEPARHMTTLLEHAMKRGWRTGLVATSRINHATPGAFAAHRTNRNQPFDISKDMANSGVDLLLGAGSEYFENRPDKANLFESMKAAGYQIATSPEDWAKVSGSKAVALFHPKDMPAVTSGQRAMSLKDMVTSAVAFMDRDNPEGWVLMVEGSQIDWCGHDLDASCAIAETLDFDDAVGAALDYSRGRDDTLVVVTADHETGGMATIDPYYADRFVKPLGGVQAVVGRVALGNKGESADPVESFALGARSAERKESALSGNTAWGLDEVEDDRFTLTWGYFSLASRPLWTSDDRFWGAHTVTLVPVFAEGPSANFVSSQMDNADVGQALIDLVNGTHPATEHVQSNTRPKNVILMIGDGYGFNAMALGNYTLGDLNARALPVRGYVSTHAVDRVVNDSAATATALATGKRTRAKATGTVVQDGKLVAGVSVLAAAESRGIATGLVTSTQLTHATPAAFFGTQEDRGNLPGLANDFLTFKDRSGGDGIDIAIAGGRSSFDAKQREQLEAQGYKVVDAFEPKATQNTVMLLAPEGLSGARARLRGNSPQPSLAKMTNAALERLSTDQDGFFLMVEGGQIDWKLHDGAKDETLVAEIQDFDEAVAAARAYVAAHPDTLLIVTADHDHTISVLDNHYPFASGRCGVAKRCGGSETFDELAVKVDGLVHADGFRDPAVRGDWPPAAVLVQYAWIVEEAMKKESLKAPHSAHFVPLFAQGPWSEELRGYSDQPEVGQLLHRWAETLSD